MIAEKSNHPPYNPAISVGGTIIAVLIAIAPKCPLCWAAYLSLLGLTSTPLLMLGSWILPILILLFVIHLAAIGKRAVQRKHYLPLMLSSVGFAMMLIAFYADVDVLRYPGLLLVMAGSITNALRRRCPKNGGICHCRQNSTL